MLGKGLFDTLAAFVLPPAAAESVEVVDMEALHDFHAPSRFQFHDGDKFAGGFGPTHLMIVDYWTLRARSAQLFRTNLYARGLIRRLVTNEINTGLHLEAMPEESILGVEEDSLGDWSEMVENRFTLWGKSPKLCDAKMAQTFGELQKEIRRESLIEGDILVVILQDPITLLPRIQLISGSNVQTPLGHSLASDTLIQHGVELDSNNRHVAFWIRQKDGQSKRLEAFGRKSGRRLAWLVYGTDKRKDDVRGEPLLSIILQSLREVDRYRDSAQRKALINSLLAMFIKKTEDKPGTKPITGGAVRRGVKTVETVDGPRQFNIQEHHPGMIMEELQVGETPEGFMPHGTDEKFGDFEKVIMSAVAWANEIPPEILTLSFSSNYSASQAAIQEFKMYLNMARTKFGNEFCQPIYEDWLISETLNKRVAVAGFLEAWRDPLKYDTFGAWLMADWGGNIKPAIDMAKLTRAYTEQVHEGFLTRDRASRELTGTKYSKNVQKLKRENAQLAEANESIVAMERAPVPSAEETDEEERKENDVATETGSSAGTPAPGEHRHLRAAN